MLVHALHRKLFDVAYDQPVSIIGNDVGPYVSVSTVGFLLPYLFSVYVMIFCLT